MNNIKNLPLWPFVLAIVFVFGIFLSKFDLFRAENELLPASIGRIQSGSSGHILIKFKSDISSERRSQIMSSYELNETLELKHIGVKLISIPVGRNSELVAESLWKNESDAVEFAEPDFIVEPSLMPNDPWFLNWQKDKQQIKTPGAWDTTTGSDNLILGVVDTGVNCFHEDLMSRCVNGWNFYDSNNNTVDVNGHGTAVAGVAVAVGNNGIGVTGVVWQSRIMPLRVSASDGTASYSTIAAAIIYAADNGARVVNNSYQTSGSSTVRSAASYLKSKGGLLVVSEGNYGSDTGYSNNSDIISVSAVDSGDIKYSWSSFGADVDVSAPGCTGATTLNSGGYGGFCGTSNSAPEAAGLLMLIWSAKPSLTPDQVRDVLFKSSKDLGTAGWDQYYGWGRIDAQAAVIMAINGGIISSSMPLPTSIPTISPTLTLNPTPIRIKHTPKSR